MKYIKTYEDYEDYFDFKIGDVVVCISDNLESADNNDLVPKINQKYVVKGIRLGYLLIDSLQKTNLIPCYWFPTNFIPELEYNIKKYNL